MWFCEHNCFSSARKPVISGYDFPLTIYNQFDCIEISRVDVEQESISDELGVNSDDGSNAAQEVAVSNRPLDNVLGLYFLGLADPTFLTHQHRSCHLKNKKLVVKDVVRRNV